MTGTITLTAACCRLVRIPARRHSAMPRLGPAKTYLQSLEESGQHEKKRHAGRSVPRSFGVKLPRKKVPVIGSIDGTTGDRTPWRSRQCRRVEGWVMIRCRSFRVLIMVAMALAGLGCTVIPQRKAPIKAAAADTNAYALRVLEEMGDPSLSPSVDDPRFHEDTHRPRPPVRMGCGCGR